MTTSVIIKNNGPGEVAVRNHGSPVDVNAPQVRCFTILKKGQATDASAWSDNIIEVTEVSGE